MIELILKLLLFYDIPGLCHNNLHQAADEKFRPTSGDLQGFWDMLMLQVNHIDKLFEEVEALKKNGWKVRESVNTRN